MSGGAQIVLSAQHARLALEARQIGSPAVVLSLDLGLSTAELPLHDAGLLLPTGDYLGWGCLEEVAAAPTSCFVVERGSVRKIQAFSALTNRYYSLFPTAGAPTMLAAGLPMHRVQDTDPWRDTLSKIKAAGLAQRRAHWRVLDTCTGLGYTAIAAARAADEVVTIELDPAAQEIARHNPWSRPLFELPTIRRLIGDSADLIEQFEEASFACVIHDPPAFALAGELYGLRFYQQLWRVLRSGGRLFHYIGDLDSKSGARVARGVMERLRQAGFPRVVPRYEAFGVAAVKE
ncbi:MAG: methyltransferase domain-containing protein [Anaerolineae bacterium]|nr:RsmD family RNA methyltransferase [Thermoflexales bacterium]MDW8407580.1 methyltransferase domain-containing protein [Anaerolineae bacterium]